MFYNVPHKFHSALTVVYKKPVVSVSLSVSQQKYRKITRILFVHESDSIYFMHFEQYVITTSSGLSLYPDHRLRAV